MAQESPVSALLDHLLDEIDPGVVSARPIDELRSLRDRYQEIENGLSFGRRLVQGRLDILVAELDGRAAGGSSTVADLLDRLPEVLAQHTRGGGVPRPVRETELPAFTDQVAAEVERIVPADALTQLGQRSDAELLELVEKLRSVERQVSAKRHEVHRIIDELQEEIVGRYRSGAASVDDLLA
jgi:hypothetical protein